MAEFMKARLINSGNVIEVIEYEKPIMYGYAREYEVSPRGEIGSTEEIGKRQDSLTRSRQMIRQYIWSNIGKYPKFFTLTYAETNLDYEQFKYDWQQFIKRMSRQGIRLRYLYVLENQKERGEKEGNEGSIHAHVVVFNDEYIPWEILRKAWGKGNIDINVIDHVKNLGAYVCKYLQKESMQAYGTYAYHVSRGLNKPVNTRIDIDDNTSLDKLTEGATVLYESTVYDDVTEQFIKYKQLKKG